MAEDADFSPGDWTGHDFSAAYKHIDATAGRSYAAAVSANKSHADLLPTSISTRSTAPVSIVADVTGSMGVWPKVMFSKLPYLEVEGKEYLGPDLEFGWLAVGDANGDTYPLQARPFTKGTALKDELEKLVIEGGGGGTVHESYELAALYALHNIHVDSAIRPIIIFIGDEAAYDRISKEQAKDIAFVDLEKSVSTKEVFQQLRKKFSVYIIQKPYNEMNGDERMTGQNKAIHDGWAELVGEDHVAILSEPGRVVDVIFGIFAKETERIDYFQKEIGDRQKPEQVETVMKSLKTIHALPPPPSRHSGKSVVVRPKGGGPVTRTKSLI